MYLIMEIPQSQLSIIEGYIEEDHYESVLELLIVFTTPQYYPPQWLLEKLTNIFYLHQDDFNLTLAFNHYLKRLYALHSPWENSSIWTPIPTCTNLTNECSEDNWNVFIHCLSSTELLNKSKASANQTELFLNLHVDLLCEDMLHVKNDSYASCMLNQLLLSSAKNTTRLRASLVSLLDSIYHFISEDDKLTSSFQRLVLAKKLLSLLYILYRTKNLAHLSLHELVYARVISLLSSVDVLVFLHILDDDFQAESCLYYLSHKYTITSRDKNLENCWNVQHSQFLLADLFLHIQPKATEQGEKKKVAKKDQTSLSSADNLYILLCLLRLLWQNYVKMGRVQYPNDTHLALIYAHFNNLSKKHGKSEAVDNAIQKLANCLKKEGESS